MTDYDLGIARDIGGLQADVRLDMPPYRSAFDVGDRRPAYAKAFSQDPMEFRAGANFQHGLLGQLGALVGTSVRCCAMQLGISAVFLLCAPPKIADVVVQRISVTMQRVVLWGRRRPNKNLQNKPVHPAGYDLPIVRDEVGANVISVWAPVASGENMSGRITSRPLYQSLDATMVTNRIGRRVGYRFPNFVGVIRVSHYEFILRGGQGLALLTQRLRPVFFSRNADHFQALVTP